MLTSQPYLKAYIQARLEEKCQKGEYSHVFNYTFEQEIKANAPEITADIIRDRETLQSIDACIEEHLRLYILNK